MIHLVNVEIEMDWDTEVMEIAVNGAPDADAAMREAFNFARSQGEVGGIQGEIEVITAIRPSMTSIQFQNR